MFLPKAIVYRNLKSVNVNQDIKRKIPLFFFFGLTWRNDVIAAFLIKFYHICTGMKEEIYCIGRMEPFIPLLSLKDNTIIFIPII